RVMPWSYMKFPYFKPAGWPDGYYRVGPLARINVADGLSTPLAQEEFERYEQIALSGLMGASLLYHYTRLMEILYALERAEELLTDKNITSTDIRFTADPSREEGVGVIEAPRGVLIHHYMVDGYGRITKANLIVATCHNNMAMNRSIQLVAREYINNGQVKEGILNRVEGAIRCYDPCLSCATHALGQMPLKVQVYSSNGELLTELQRD
ncbi:MAG: nickel-dependent hydrogenase large subunit, partial [Deltaproteobacteria bacterium]|nr:nickel-dependent hydrogenase large subunit [Deltaproteobacteria bacterium]